MPVPERCLAAEIPQLIRPILTLIVVVVRRRAHQDVRSLLAGEKLAQRKDLRRGPLLVQFEHSAFSFIEGWKLGIEQISVSKPSFGERPYVLHSRIVGDVPYRATGGR